jgi:hypothetical protein
MRLGVIYKVSIGDNFIIGSSIDYKTRWSVYLNKLSTNTWENIYLQRSYNKYGKESLKFEILQKDIPENILECVEDVWMGSLCGMAEDNKKGMNLKSANRPKFSKEICENISSSLRKIVYQYDIDGNFIKEWKSAKYASLALNIERASISSVCCGTYKSAGNFIWSYEKEISVSKYSSNTGKLFRTSVKRISLVDNTSKIFASMKEAALDLGIKSYCNISSCCKGVRNTAFGFKWEYV